MAYINLKLAKKNKTVNPESWDELYSSLVESEIRKKYSIGNELAILRQRDSKPQEFEEYNAYVEACKTKIKNIMK